MSKKIINLATFGLSSLIPGKVGKIIRGAALVVAGVVTGNPGLIIAGVTMAAGAFVKKPKVSTNALDRLNASLDPHAGRKIWLGFTAGGTDVRYQAATGTDQEYIHWIMAQASHKAKGDFELWFDTEKAWSSSGGVTTKFSGYLTVDERNPGTSANGIAIDSKWTATATLTGCTYLHIRFKLTGNSKKAESPFAQSLPTRVTVRGRGALLPDLREGGVDASDQTTWDWFDDDSGRNPAWQLLFYLIGWRINGKLAVGRGIPPERIDLDSFITAANLCDEPITLALGGTEPRYRCDGLYGEDDSADLVIGNLCASMNAVLRDTGGLIGVQVYHNDLSTPVANFDDSDIIADDLEWLQTPDLPQFFSIVRGRYVDPSDAALYQMRDYPEVAIASPDGIDRVDPLDLPMVQSFGQAQRLAKQRLQRNLYRGALSGTFSERAWQVSVGDIVTFSLIALGWDYKLFRVASHGMTLAGAVQMTLAEESAALYAWDAEESAPVVAAAPTVYDWANSPLIKALQDLEALGIVGYITNESHTVPASSAGVVSSYSGASGAFRALQGTTDISNQFTLATLSGGNPQALTVTYDNGVNPRTYSVTGAGTSSGNFGHSGTDSASLTIRATGSGTYAGVVIDRVFSLTKSKAGAGGADAKLLTISSTFQTVAYTGAGAANPSVQTNTFTANKINTTATVTWTVFDADGTARTPTTTYLSAATGDSVTMTEAQFAAARNGTSGVRVVGTLTDGVTLTDRISVTRVQAGLDGTNAKTITVESDRIAFTFDGGGNLAPGTQAAVVTANPQNFTGGAVVWTYADNLGTASATLAALVTATSANVRTVPSTVFSATPTRLWLQVIATGQGAESALFDAETIYRLDAGSGALVMLLTNEAHNVPTDSAGASGDFSGANGLVKVFYGTADVTAAATLSEVSETNLTGDINTAANTPVGSQPKGYYRVTALSADSGTYRVRASYNPGSGAITADRDFSVAKSRQGTGGSPGADAISASALPPAISVPCTPTGTPLDAVPGFSITAYKGATNVTATATGTTYTILGSSGLSSLTHAGDGVFTVSGISADAAYADIQVTNGTTQIIRVTYAKILAGSAANASVPTSFSSMNDTSTYATIATLADIAVTDGATLSADANGLFSISSGYTNKYKITYENITDSGTETDFPGSEVTEGLVVAGNPQSMGTTGTWTNSLGSTKVMRVRFVQKRNAGGGSTSGVDGTLAAHT